jgi:hypothetical protein
LSILNELLCSQIQLQFYYHSGDYIAITDLYRLLTKCTNTPDLMLRKLIELGIVTITDKQNVVQLK